MTRKKVYERKTTQYLIGYMRVSTDDQNMELQSDALITAGVDPKNIYEDTMTGSRADRPGLEQALKALRKGDVLVVWRLDILGRSIKDLITISEGLEANGVGFRSLQENIETSSASGKLYFSLMAAFAELERNLIRERTKAGPAAPLKRGKKRGRKLKLDDTQLCIAKALLKEGDLSVVDIAQGLGVSAPTLYRRIPAAGARYPVAIKEV